MDLPTQRHDLFPSTLDALLSRRSVGALREPGPSGPELERMLETALRAPDHGWLRPWRFVLIRGEARARWADTVEAAMRARDPEVTPPMIEKQRRRILGAPVIIALGAQIREGKIPELEQLLTVGAGAMNLLNALHAAGYGGIWLTGANAYDPRLAEALGLAPPNRLLGFLFAGTPAEELPPAPRRPALEGFVSDWTG
ncbi:nitroreductase [Roseomonas sp. BN140053]|uniref:nitroreductase family protein n=1 Tax=Roseomonas sp. BN140053 TaxID=3391898 RepID=UPI0039EBBBFB